jgi:hypothetical protein
MTSTGSLATTDESRTHQSMTTSRQPKGVPVGGQFAATPHSEGAVTLAKPRNPDQLARVTSLLAAEAVQWEQEKFRLAKGSEARTARRRRLSGARAASRILSEFPDAATVTYTRDPGNGIVSLDEIADDEGRPLYYGEDLNGSVLAGTSREINRRIAVRQGLRQLMGQALPPDYADQGIKVLYEDGDTEQLHLQTALTDGLAALEDEPSPAEASRQRVESALAQWNDPDDAHTRVRDMLTDLRHYAAEHGIDLDHALDRSYTVFLEEHNDPAFKEGF